MFKCFIDNLPNAEKDGRCWKLVIRKKNKVVYKGTYTAKIGAERAAKRQLKRLEAAL
jgi:hypothetical protein